MKAGLETLPVFISARPQPSERLIEHKVEEVALSLLESDSRVWPLLNRISTENRSLVRYVEAHRHRRSSLRELARGAGHSLSTFKRRFHVATGLTPAAWLREQRLVRARVLLETTDRTVTDIALDSGFASVSHFVQAFRRQRRVTPHKVRTVRTA